MWNHVIPYTNNNTFEMGGFMFAKYPTISFMVCDLGTSVHVQEYYSLVISTM